MSKNVEVVKVKRIQALDIINRQDGKFFTAIFASKIDGRECRVNGRTGVTKYLRGRNTSASQDVHDDLKTAFNVKKMAYRKIFLDGIKEIRASNKIYSFE